jgi:hypothetical protein
MASKTKQLEKDKSATTEKGLLSVCGNAMMEHIKISGRGNKRGATRVEAEVNIGFGNTLYIRGAGCGLSWDKGVAMENKDVSFWVFETNKCKDDFEYKLLINDELWCEGENFVAKCHEKSTIAPKF